MPSTKVPLFLGWEDLWPWLWHLLFLIHLGAYTADRRTADVVYVPFSDNPNICSRLHTWLGLLHLCEHAERLAAVFAACSAEGWQNAGGTARARPTGGHDSDRLVGVVPGEPGA